MFGIPETILLLLLLVLPIGCLANWAAGFKQMSLGEPLLPVTPRDNVPWGLVDLGVVVLLVAMIAGLGVVLIRAWVGIDSRAQLASLTANEQAIVFFSFGTATLIATAMSFGWIALRYQAVEGFGFDRKYLRADIELGLRWFMMLVVPILLLQVILTRWFPTQHPLIEMLRQSKNVSFLPVAAYAAVVAAPVFEEAFFRLFLQGWLEKLQVTMCRSELGIGGKADREAVILGGPSSANVDLELEDPIASARPYEGGEVVQPIASDDPNNPYRASFATAVNVSSADSSREGRDRHRPVMWLPILVSSGLFALAHLSHGPDWIPLFFLAMGLGFLYQRTGRIQACIVVHILVNSLGVLQLWSAIRQG